MAVLHYAFTFHLPAFRERFLTRCIGGDAYHSDVLLAWAKDVSSTASGAAAEALMALRYDEDWLRAAPPGEVQPHLWLLAALAEKFERAPSLSHRFKANFYVLKQVLPLMGWSAEQTDRLWLGNDLADLVQEIDSELSASFPHASLYRGWLDRAAIESFLHWFAAHPALFRSPDTAVRQALSEYAASVQAPVHEVLLSAYKDAVDMLDTARLRRAELFLILD
ncbi:MAG: hypothetical protein K8F27_06795 [Sulfuricellaceae bacterium]|nr:hypothetical protein [Sulfuricellaceae bacterium]